MPELSNLNLPLGMSEKKKRAARPSAAWLPISAAVAVGAAVLLIAVGVWLNRPPTPLPDMSGHWNGTLYQDPGGSAASYFFEMYIQYTSATTLEGTTHIRLANSNYAVMAFAGELTATGLRFEETRILEQATTPDIRWCIKHGTLMLTDAETLAGTWETATADCPPGRIVLNLYQRPTPAP